MRTSKELIARLNALYDVFIGVKFLYEVHLPKNTYICKNSYFSKMNIEAQKLICGKLFGLICDTKSRDEHNTVSLSILANDILSAVESDNIDLVDEYSDSFNKMISNIRLLSSNEKLKSFRDKQFAHTDLNENNTPIELKDFGISGKLIADMFNLASTGLQTMRLYLTDSSTDQMHDPIASLSSKLWECYEDAGLVKREHH